MSGMLIDNEQANAEGKSAAVVPRMCFDDHLHTKTS